MATDPAGDPEKHAADEQHHHHHTGKRLRRLIHPNGRTIHVAATPEEHETIKRKLSRADPEAEFDIFLRGSPEHLDAIREIQQHHEQQKAKLQEKHGEIFNEFERVHTELDHLSNELHDLTDHGVALDANFSKFGYSAHLRTKDTGDSPNSSRTSLSEHDWEAEKKKGKALTFWKKPIVRQYFHKGLLWRASDTEEVQSFELFVDLLYVGIIAVVGDAAAEDTTGYGLLRFCVTFILGWKMWADLTLIISWFESDDILQRISVLFVMVCLVGYTVNITSSFDTTWTMMVAFYLTQRLFAAAYFVWISYLIPMIRGTMLGHTALLVVSCALWIGSCHVDYPRQLAIIWIAIAFDLFSSIWIVMIMRFTQKGDTPLARRLAKHFDFWPALNIEHKTERTNAFTTLVFGYSVLALLFQNRAHYGINAFFGKAVLGLIQAFAFNWLYFEIDAFNLHTHAIRRHIFSSFTWITVHLPFIMSYVLAGACLSKIVLAHDCPDADVEDLTETYILRSEEHLSHGLRWFYCCGLGIALLSMSIISMSHVHKEIKNQRIAKYPRLAVRVAAAIILICLPLAADHLNSLQLVGTTTGVVVFVLMVDVYGSTSRNDSFWSDRGKCRYSTRCALKRRELQEVMKRGETVEIRELVEGGRGEKAAFQVH